MATKGGNSLVGYFEVRIEGMDKNATPELIEIHGNEQFYLGRNALFCRQSWPDPTISNRHIRIHCVLYEKDPIANIAPFLYATDISTNGTFLKKSKLKYMSSQNDQGQLMGRNNGSFLLDDGDELRMSNIVTLIYREMQESREHRLTFLQEQEKQLFASRYLITGRLLGMGGYGKVLVGIHQKTRRQLACKVVNLRRLYDGALTPDPQMFVASETQGSTPTGTQKRWPSKVTRCFREFDVLKNLNHPNIISVEKVFWSYNSIYIFEELITGGDLFSFLEYKGGRLADVEAAVIVRQILKGVEYLHNQDIVHRDLKPDNILITSLEDGARIVITDFGNARMLPKTHGKNLSCSVSSKRMFSVVGTLEYVAPEIHRANRTIPRDEGYTKAVDMWSVGSITSALLSGDIIFINRNDPRYEHDPFGIIIGLASECDIGILDDEYDKIWGNVGDRPKDFIKNLLVLRENDRMTASQALAHPWFSNDRHAAEYEALYKRSTRDWAPRHRTSRLVECIQENSSDAKQPPHTSSHHFILPSLLRSEPKQRRNRSPSRYRNQTRALSPVEEGHEDPLFKAFSLRDLKSCDSDTGNLGCQQNFAQSMRPSSIGNSMNWFSLYPDPPTLGMYLTYENAQNSDRYGKMVAEATYKSRQQRSPIVGSRRHTPELQSETPLIPETPAKVERGFPLEPDSQIIYETPIRLTKKRYRSPEAILPNYNSVLSHGETADQADTPYMGQGKLKKRKLVPEFCGSHEP